MPSTGPSRRRFPRRVYLAVLRRQRVQCACCGSRLRRGYAFDHVLPLWCGGTDTPDNLQALNAECHARKTAEEAKARAKTDRLRGATGTGRKRALWRSRPLGSRYWKRKVDGSVVRRGEG